MEQDCIFCKIIAGEIPSPRLYEDDKMIIIRDVAPRNIITCAYRKSISHISPI